MVGTRASIKESERIFQKVILGNLGEKSSGDIWQALQQDGIHTFADLGTLTFSDVDELKNTVSTETEQGTQTSDGSKPRKPIIYGSLFFIWHLPNFIWQMPYKFLLSLIFCFT